MDKRIRWLFIIFLVCFAAVVLRLFVLQVVQHVFFQGKSAEQRTRIIDLSANRGDILDCNGEILATSIDTYSVFSQDGGFAWVARRLPRAEAEEIRSADPQRYFLLREKKRLYPRGRTAAQVIGFVGADNQGLSGVEISFDKYLKGKTGRVVTEGDPQGRELYGAVREIDPSADGMNITLTIDKNIQYVAEKFLAAQLKASHAAAGQLFVMRAKTGELLAVASKPDFDPSDYKKSPPALWHPRCLDPYEPGSTFKLITTAAGLEDGAVTPGTKLKALDRIEIGGKVIENSHQISWPGASVSLSFMLEKSINTAAAQVGLLLGPEKFYGRIRRFGFGAATGFGLDGESAGILRPWRRWYKPDIGMITFGQGIAVTPLQLLRAVSAFANGGRLVEPLLIKRIESSDGKFVKLSEAEFAGRAVSEQTAEVMKTLMRNVCLRGSGSKAQIGRFAVGGKTGTAQKSARGGRGYLKGRYIASFIGIAPLGDPEIIALVIVDDPQGSIWGETVCGPVFKNVVEYTLRYLNVKPDMI
ncbi:MAG: penicillin-binding protein 2 [Candidatus Saganbacteria bacterium]|nr:penicillin-binding protein 2 [Candidatus Saganbacteria bacterium]